MNRQLHTLRSFNRASLTTRQERRTRSPSYAFVQKSRDLLLDFLLFVHPVFVSHFISVTKCSSCFLSAVNRIMQFVELIYRSGTDCQWTRYPISTIQRNLPTQHFKPLSSCNFSSFTKYLKLPGDLRKAVCCWCKEIICSVLAEKQLSIGRADTRKCRM